MHQIFEVGFFHADPHPGNLFVEPTNGPGAIAGASEGSRKGWRLVFVDFGMVGRLAPEARSDLRNLAIALGTRDVDRLMRAYGELGVLLPGADLDRLRQAEAAVFERLWGKSVRELMQIDPREMRRFAHEFRDLLYEMPFQMPADLIFLGRCVAILSGMCTGLDPDFNLFSELAPFARTMLTAEGGGVNVDSALTWLIEQVRVLVGLPGRLDGLLSRVERGELMVVARAAPPRGLPRRPALRPVRPTPARPPGRSRATAAPRPTPPGARCPTACGETRRPPA